MSVNASAFRPELIIFDCDGVLLDSEIIACAADAEALTAFGYPITTEEMSRRFAGIPAKALYAEIEAETGRAFPPGFMVTVKARIMEKYRTELTPIPGAAEVLEALPLPKCVASSSAPAKLALGLIECGLYDLVYPNIFSARLVARGKPHPDIFEYAAAKMETAPANCLVIEDSVAGITAATAAGMPSIGFTGGSHCGPGLDKRLLAAGASEVITDLRGVLSLAGSPAGG